MGGGKLVAALPSLTVGVPYRNPDREGGEHVHFPFPAPNYPMKTAIVGLPMVGKTSLFTILTGVHESARVGSLEARVGVTKVPDGRLDCPGEDL